MDNTDRVINHIVRVLRVSHVQVYGREEPADDVTGAVDILRKLAEDRQLVPVFSGCLLRVGGLILRFLQTDCGFNCEVGPAAESRYEDTQFVHLRRVYSLYEFILAIRDGITVWERLGGSNDTGIGV